MNISIWLKTGLCRTSFTICPHLVQGQVSNTYVAVLTGFGMLRSNVYQWTAEDFSLFSSAQVCLCLSKGLWLEQLSSKKSLVRGVLARCGEDVGGVVTLR